MGFDPPPDSGDFITGWQCNCCTNIALNLFKPAETPKYIRLRVFLQTAQVADILLTQKGQFQPCQWEAGDLQAGPEYGFVTFGCTPSFTEIGYTARPGPGEDPTIAFYYGTVPACQTTGYNQASGPGSDQATHAIIDWGEALHP